MNNIDLILYINLDSRADRKAKITSELEPFRKIGTKIVRISACACPYDPPLGCLLSHIVCLKYSLTEEHYRNILILEDDFIFTKDSRELDSILKEFFSRTELLWDCILLSYSQTKSREYDHLISYIEDAQMTSGYLIRREAVNDLLRVYQEAVVGLVKTKKTIIYAADRIWNQLMQKNTWFIFNDRLGVQSLSYSDITGLMRKNFSDQDHLSKDRRYPLTCVIYDEHSVEVADMLAGIMNRDSIYYMVSLNDDESLTEDFEVVILLGNTRLSDKWSNNKCFHIIEDPDIYPSLSFKELLSNTGYIYDTCYVKVNSGLGNQLFQVAAGVAYCKKTNKNLRLLVEEKNERGYYWETVLSNYKDCVVKRTTKPNIYKYVEPCFDYREIPRVQRDILLEGYFQSSKYWKNFSEDFTPKIDFGDKFPENYVLVHARRGDYCVQPFLDKHGLLTDEYYAKARNMIKSKIESPVFVLTSDDPNFWQGSAKTVFQGEEVRFYNGDSLETLSYFSSFRNIIMSNSTFAWWGVYFANMNCAKQGGTNMVVAPKKWFGKLGPHQTPDIYEDSWIIL